MLALLAIEGKRSAYDLVKLAEKAIGHIWSPARSGLYAVIPRLVKNGLALQRGGSEKRLYTISRDGRRALGCIRLSQVRGRHFS